MPDVTLLPLFFNTKVVTAEEMARIDQLAIRDGCSEENFIDTAGKRIAEHAMQMGQKKILLLVGKGNKGADAFAAGTALLEEGYQVKAFCPFEKGSVWNQKKRQEFLKRGGRVIEKFEGDLIIDGLLGTGFKGKVEGIVEMAILNANGSGRPILSIDLPSGLNGTTGEVRGACIKACKTVTFGAAKSGLFLRVGWNHCGELAVEDFGMPEKYLKMANEIAYLLDPRLLSLPEIKRNRHKYEAGYVIGFSGSKALPGAPKMAALAALRSGAGIVRIFYKDGIGEVPMEVISQKWNGKDWAKEMQRANAIFAGPGLGKQKLVSMTKPCVIDADLLQKGVLFPKNAILTPHRGEMLRLLGLKHLPEEEEFLASCQKFVQKNKVVLVLKGAPTILFARDKPPLIVASGDPGMATAGMGDILTGVISSLLAQKMEPYVAAATGVYLHASAGEIAAKLKTSYGLIARDVIEHLPSAFAALCDSSCTIQ